jgi:hypothetical protein
MFLTHREKYITREGRHRTGGKKKIKEHALEEHMSKEATYPSMVVDCHDINACERTDIKVFFSFLLPFIFFRRLFE